MVWSLQTARALWQIWYGNLSPFCHPSLPILLSPALSYQSFRKISRAVYFKIRDCSAWVLVRFWKNISLLSFWNSLWLRWCRAKKSTIFFAEKLIGAHDIFGPLNFVHCHCMVVTPFLFSRRNSSRNCGTTMTWARTSLVREYEFEFRHNFCTRTFEGLSMRTN